MPTSPERGLSEGIDPQNVGCNDDMAEGGNSSVPMIEPLERVNHIPERLCSG